MKRLVQLGVAKKLYDELRKPENQRKIKEAMSAAQRKAQSRRKH